MKRVEEGAREDVWIPTICGMCLNTCHILARRMDGKVVQIEGNPDSPLNGGKNCPKSQAAVMTLYDPSRVKYPLKRTNPNKGFDQDPGWKRISWDEALDIITERLGDALDYDPKSVFVAGGLGDRLGVKLVFAFAAALGHPGGFTVGGHQCGNGEHMVAVLQSGHGWAMPDWKYMRYFLCFGTRCGDGTAHWNNMSMAVGMAEARARMKLVVIDPWMSPLAEKADEWIPIRPGTDAMFALAMLNVLLNRLEIYDRDALKRETNGPYLIKPDGFYMTSKDGKAQIWDSADGKVKAWDDETVTDPALEGEYSVTGIKCKTAFQVLKDHVLRYTPEEAEKITTVPAETIVRVAREFGEAASVGSTITVEGKVLPYRPVQAKYSKGAQSHKHSYLAALSLELLNHVVGACDVPGGAGASSVCFGYPETGQPNWSPAAGPDGLIMAGLNSFGFNRWPPPKVTWPPVTQGGDELFPLAIQGGASWPMILQPEAFGRPSPKVLITKAVNMAMNNMDPSAVQEGLRKIPFHVNFAIHLDETAEMADIVLPETHFLETQDLPGIHYDLAWYWNQPHMEEWVAPIRQPVVEPAHEERPALEVFLELVERLNLRAQFYGVLNFMYMLEGNKALDAGRRYTIEEVADSILRAHYGPQHGLEYMKEHGLLKWPKKLEEKYWRPFTKVKTPIYMEWFPRVGEELEKVVREAELPARFTPDFSDYSPLPDWRPCPAYQEERPAYDLYFVYYHHTLMTGSSSLTYNNAWLDEVARLLDPEVYCITMNAETARRKRIKDGDWVWVESASTGQRVKGRVKLSLCIHPEVIASANNGGHWARGLPIASREGKGVTWEWMLPLDLRNKWCGVSANPDLCEKVQVYKA